MSDQPSFTVVFACGEGDTPSAGESGNDFSAYRVIAIANGDYTERLNDAENQLAEARAENAKLREDRTHLGKMLHDSRAERDMLRQRLHMAEEQIRECRQYLRLDDRNLVVGHIDAYFALPALNSGEGE